MLPAYKRSRRHRVTADYERFMESEVYKYDLATVYTQDWVWKRKGSITTNA
jgi:hypothetical protein